MMQTPVLERPVETRVTPERIIQTVYGFAPAYLLDAAARLGIFDALADGSKTTSQIARDCSVSARGAKAVLNALAGLKFLTRENGAYGLTAESAAFLVRGKPAYLGGLLRHGVQSIVPHWAHLQETVRTGKPAVPVNREAEGAGYFATFVADLFAPNFASAQVLAKTLASGHPSPAAALDLAAGSAVFGIALALEVPGITVTAIDWKDVIPVTRKIVSQFKLDERFRFVEGDLLDVDFGSDYSVAVLGQVLHTNGPDWARRVIKKTYDALVPGGTIAIAEWLVNDDRTGPPPSLIFAVNMLVHLEDGDTYSFSEISGWLREAGFKSVRTLDVPGPSPLILAEK